MFWVQYYCPRQGPVWHTSRGSWNDLQAAIAVAWTVKPQFGNSRVIDAQGRIHFEC